MERKVVIACDHAGNEVKDAIIQDLRAKGYTVTDFGCDGTVSVNYPDYAHLVCGTGIGMSMAANKHRGIRAALCENPFSAEMTRRHNDANVICLGARVLPVETAVSLANIFLETPYEGGRHDARVAMRNALDDNG